MAIGYDDEFDYLDDEDDSNADDAFAPKIKGASKPSLVPEEPVVEEVKVEEKVEEKPKREFESSIYIVKVTTNKEDKALEMIADKVKKKGVGIYAIARPHGLRGYIFLESPDHKHAEDAVFNLPYVKGIIGKTISYEEIKNMIEPSATTISIKEGDIVEIIAEPFKKEKAKVLRIDKVKEVVVVSLLGAVVPLPVTVKIDNIKVIRREEDEN
jgi:transcriptional antiterminator NusG